MLLPDNGVCGVVTDFECSTLTSSRWLSQPVAPNAVARTPTAI